MTTWKAIVFLIWEYINDIVTLLIN